MCNECRWLARKDRLELLLADQKYRWAFDTLKGISDYIEKEKHVTEKQTRAVQNIMNAVQRRTNVSGSRK